MKAEHIPLKSERKGIKMATEVEGTIRLFEVFSDRTKQSYLVYASDMESAIDIATKEKREFPGYFNRAVIVGKERD